MENQYSCDEMWGKIEKQTYSLDELRCNADGKWNELFFDIHEAYTRLHTYKLTITIKNGLPTYWEIRFSNPDISQFKRLKNYAGEFGFVVPTLGAPGRKILRWEKLLKYKVSKTWVWGG